MERMSGESLNIVANNIQKLKQTFPEVFNEDKVDFEKLEAVLGEYKDNGVERYNFSWPGKSKAIRISQTPSTGTLRPCKEESKDWDTTQNLYIEGDNLEVLKLLQKSYYGKIKMIYIDPPYNTGKDFVYKDDFKDNIENYLEVTGQKDSEGNKTTTNTESNGRYHSIWLNMMYPRLKLARNLLKDDGVIFVSIDDNEDSNLKKICDEIFGEGNFICRFIRKGSGGRQDSKYYAIVHEYIYCYAKNSNCYISGKIIKEDESYPFYDEKLKLHYKNQLLRKWGENSKRSDRPNLFYPINDPDGNKNYPMLSDTEEGCWRWGRETMMKNISNGKVEFKKRNGKWIAYEKIFEPADGNYKTKLYNTIIDDISNNTGASLLRELFEGKIFDYPKPVDLILKVLKLGCTSKDDIILDFFSGSGTTAHAIMQLNQDDNENRRFIMVQLPEECEEKSEAYKVGYNNICEIGKERIRRAGDKIKEENKDKEGIEDLDIGFKVFKLDSSNINRWDSSYDQDLEHSLLSSIDNIKEGRTEEDILYEVLLKYGIDLNMPIEEHDINGKKVFDIGFGAIIACLDDNISLDVVEGIGKLKEELNPDTCRVVFMDNGFSSDSVKTNAVQILKRFNIDDVKSI